MLHTIKWFLIIGFASFLTACGGGGDDPTANEQQMAIESIANYAQNGQLAPTVEDYENAGVTGVTEENLAQINAAVESLNYEDVDTKEEIQALLDSLGLSCAQIITHAYNPSTGEENDFATPCDVPEGWVVGTPADTVKPVITLRGDMVVTLTVGDTYIDAGATAMDDRDGDISTNIVIHSTVDTATAGTYTVSYDVNDTAGNAAVQVVRTVHVVVDTNKKIFLIGDSTMRYDFDGDRDPDGPLHRTGWGSKLSVYMLHPENAFNRARRAAIAGGIEDNVNSYRREAEIDPWIAENKGPYDWSTTRALIEESNVSNGGFLLIQFGANDKYAGISETDFKAHLLFYITEARDLGLTPILVTPVNPKSTLTDTRTPYTDYITDVAAQEGVSLIDLHHRSLEVYANYTLEQRYGLFGAWQLDGVMRDTTHFDRQGATIVADWVRDSACAVSEMQRLCEQFVPDQAYLFAYAGEDQNVTAGTVVELNASAYDTQDEQLHYQWKEGENTLSELPQLQYEATEAGIHTLTVTVTDASGKSTTDSVVITVTEEAAVRVLHEDAEDGETTGWAIYDNDPEGAVVNNVEDTDKGSRVIELSTPNGIENGFSLTNLNITQGFFVSWSMKTSEDFRFFIKLKTSGHDPLYLEYAPVDVDEGYVEVSGKEYLRIGLGSYTDDDRWIHVVRDVEADLKRTFPDETIEEIYGFYIRGAMRVDDIQTAITGEVTERITRVDDTVTASSGSQMNVSIYYQKEGVAKPTLYFVAGGGLDHHGYEHLLYHLVEQGYVVVAASYAEGFNDTHIADNFFDAFVKGWQLCEDRGINDDTRTGLIGHSSGAGTLPSLGYKFFIEQGMGSNGRFVFGATPWVDFQWEAYKYLPADTHFVTQWYEDDHDTDPRIYLDMYRHMAVEHKSFMILKQQSDHYTIMNGTPLPLVEEGIYKPLDALAHYTFEGSDKALVFPETGSDDENLKIFPEGGVPDSTTYEGMMQSFADAGSPYPCDSAASGHYDPNPRLQQCEAYSTGYTYAASGGFAQATEVPLARPAYLSAYQEPLFDTNVTRISDRANQTANIHPYPKQGSAWNSDATIIRMQYRLYDAKTFEELPVTAGLDVDHAYAKVGSPWHGAADIRWSKSDPNVMFVLDSSQRFKRVVINAERTDTTAEASLIDMSTLGYSNITTGNNEGNLDWEDQYVIFAAQKENNESVLALLYHVGDSNLTWTKEVPRGVWNGDDAHYFDWISVDPTAHYIVMNAEEKTWLYDMNLSNEVKLDDYAGHGDMGIDVNGDPTYVQMIYGGTAIRSYNLRTHASLDLLPSNYGGGHISCRNYQRPGWCYVNTSEEGYKEVFALKLDDHVSGVVERYAQTRVSYDNRGLAQVNVSPDGTKVLFGSDWGDRDNAVDTYHVEIKW